MTRLRVQSFSISLDGYGAGPNQSLQQPLGEGGMALHQWAFATRTFRRMFGQDGGSTDVDDRFAARGFDHLGAWILGRHMFGPVRGPWPDDAWKGWWGDEPPYHCPVFVLTHHARAPIEMQGGTTFHFVTEGIHAALERARAAAAGRDVRLGGGVATIRQYLAAGLVDEMHLAIAPVLLGRGESLLAGLDLPSLGWRCSEHVPTASATHVVLTRAAVARGLSAGSHTVADHERISPMSPDASTIAAFEAQARAAGFDEVLDRRWAPGTVLDAHTHDFDVMALVTEGEMWLECGGVTRHLRAGDRFDLVREAPHAERYGAAGAVYRVARRRATPAR